MFSGIENTTIMGPGGNCVKMIEISQGGEQQKGGI
jgi:hypothetical protein